MKVTADTNVLVRAAILDDLNQSRVATKLLREAELVAITLFTLCEFVWVLSRGYKIKSSEIAGTIRRLIGSATVSVDRPAVDAGLAVLEAGGDFADGVVAFDGQRLGGLVFASFDRDAVRQIKATGNQTQLLS